MSAVTGSTVSTIIGTIEILKLRVRVVDVEMELAAAIGTVFSGFSSALMVVPFRTSKISCHFSLFSGYLTHSIEL
jgi:hypothetical protein